MSISSLASLHLPAFEGNYTGGRRDKITEITVHHMAGVITAKRCGELFQAKGRQGSSHYGIDSDGTVASYVDEADTAWANGNFDANSRAVTIEVANSESGGQWPVSSRALNSLILLCADIAKRNELGKLEKGKNLTWHSMYAATACPGPYLLSKMDYIAAEANKINLPFSGELSGTDILRHTDCLVVYYKGIFGDGRTGTNKWGYEVAIDKNGVVLEAPHYSGNTKIPEGGKVLSGHGEAGKWISENISLGDLVWFEGGRAHMIKGLFKSVDCVDGQRLKDYLCIYRNGEKCPTNQWGAEAAVDKSGIAGKPVYGVGKMAIPEGGFVVSGHGKSAEWVLENIKKGKKLTFNGKVLRVL